MNNHKHQESNVEETYEIIEDNDDTFTKAYLLLEEKYNNEYAEHCELKNEHSELNDKYNKLDNEYAKLNDDYRKLNEGHTKLKDEHSELNDKYSILNDEDSKLNNEHIELKLNNNKLNNEHIELRLNNSKLDDENDELKLNNNKLNNENTELQHQYSELQEKFNKSSDEHAKLIDKFIKLNDEHAELKLNNSKLNNEHSELGDDHSELQEKFSKLNDEHFKLEHRFSKLINEFTELNYKYSELNDNPLITYKTNHLISEKEVISITTWIGKNRFNITPKLKLLYKASDHEYSALVFHCKCDNKGATIVVAVTDNGTKIGGYSSISWESKFGCKVDFCMTSFLFSLTLNEKYRLRDQNYYAIRNSNEWGPFFGDADFYIKDKCEKSDVSYTRNHYEFDTSKKSKFYGTIDDKYKIKDYEVYQVIYQ